MSFTKFSGFFYNFAKIRNLQVGVRVWSRRESFLVTKLNIKKTWVYSHIFLSLLLFAHCLFVKMSLSDKSDTNDSLQLGLGLAAVITLAV